MEDDLRDRIIRIDERTAAMAGRFDVIDKRLDAHAGKIRALENWRFFLGGLGAAVTAWLKLTK